MISNILIVAFGVVLADILEVLIDKVIDLLRR